MKYVCELCGYIYDEDTGSARSKIPAGTRFAELPEDYECPCCGYGKEAFDPVRPKGSQEVLRVQSRGKR